MLLHLALIASAMTKHAANQSSIGRVLVAVRH